MKVLQIPHGQLFGVQYLILDLKTLSDSEDDIFSRITFHNFAPRFIMDTLLNKTVEKYTFLKNNLTSQTHFNYYFFWTRMWIFLRKWTSSFWECFVYSCFCVYFVDVSVDVGNTLMKWVYTDRADIKNEEAFIMDLVKAANTYKLKALRGRYENFYFLFL